MVILESLRQHGGVFHLLSVITLRQKDKIDSPSDFPHPISAEVS
jgi:hypothetical protein